MLLYLFNCVEELSPYSPDNPIKQIFKNYKKSFKSIRKNQKVSL